MSLSFYCFSILRGQVLWETKPESRTGFPLCGGQTRTRICLLVFLFQNLPEAAANKCSAYRHITNGRHPQQWSPHRARVATAPTGCRVH